MLYGSTWRTVSSFRNWWSSNVASSGFVPESGFDICSWHFFVSLSSFADSCLNDAKKVAILQWTHSSRSLTTQTERNATKHFPNVEDFLGVAVDSRSTPCNTQIFGFVGVWNLWTTEIGNQKRSRKFYAFCFRTPVMFPQIRLLECNFGDVDQLVRVDPDLSDSFSRVQR